MVRKKEIWDMRPDQRMEQLKKLREELMHERGVSAMGGSPPSPGKIRKLRTDIARILTVQRQEERDRS
jgi:large subunit ribosomal protein L29